MSVLFDNYTELIYRAICTSFLCTLSFAVDCVKNQLSIYLSTLSVLTTTGLLYTSFTVVCQFYLTTTKMYTGPLYRFMICLLFSSTTKLYSGQLQMGTIHPSPGVMIYNLHCPVTNVLSIFIKCLHSIDCNNTETLHSQKMYRSTSAFTII